MKAIEQVNHIVVHCTATIEGKQNQLLDVLNSIEELENKLNENL